jgi:hypothetical protein
MPFHWTAAGKDLVLQRPLTGLVGCSSLCSDGILACTTQRQPRNGRHERAATFGTSSFQLEWDVGRPAIQSIGRWLHQERIVLLDRSAVQSYRRPVRTLDLASTVDGRPEAP